MARDVDNIINTAADPVESLVVSASTVTSELQVVSNSTDKLWGRCTHVVTLIHIQVCVHITLMCAVYCTCHAGPCLLKGEDTLHIVTVDLLARHRVDNCRLNTEERERRRARLRRGHARKGSNNVGPSLSLPVSLFKWSIS